MALNLSGIPSRDMLVHLIDKSPCNYFDEEVNMYIDGGLPGGGVLQSYVDDQDAKTLDSAKSYTDAEIAKIPSAKLYSTTGQNTDGAVTQKLFSDSLSTLNTSIDNLGVKLNNSVQFDTTVESNTSTVTITKTVGPLGGSGTETEMALPVASDTQAGVMNSATYKTVQENAELIQSILQSAVAVEDLPAEPTQEQLTDAWKEASGKEEIVNGAKIFDSTNNKTWTYYSNKSAWSSIDNANPTIELTNFTNEAAGQIKGDSTTDGKIQAETDGTGSVKGWDTVKSDIANNTSDIESAQSEIANIKTAIEGLGGTYALKTTVDELQKEVTDNAGDISALEADKQDKLVSSGEGQNIKTVNGNSLLGTGDIAVQAVLVASGANQNIKTINSTSLLGTGNIAIDVPEAMTVAEFTAAWNAA